VKQVVILAGGKGTRLKDASMGLPKPMVQILEKPLLQHLIEQCVEYNLLDIKLLVSYKKELIIDFFGNGKKFGVNIQYFSEDTPRGTAGALLDVLPELNNQFLVIYGDTFFEIDLGSLWKFHQDQMADASIFLHPNDHPYDSDLVEIDSNFQVQKIHPYPHDEKWRRNLVNAAVYMFNKQALEGFDFAYSKPDIAKDLFPLMLKNRKKIYGYLSTEYIKDMGTPDRLSKVERDINSGKVKLLNKQTPKSAIFLDRDGVINKEVNHLSKLEDFELIDCAASAIAKINTSGVLVVVITNQPVIARGDLDEEGLRDIHNKMDTLLGKNGAYVDRLYYCPHHPDSGFKGEVKSLKYDCNCRKPKIGMLDKARYELNIDLENSWFIGDSTRDILTAKNSNIKSALVKTGCAGEDGAYDVDPDITAKDLSQAVELILKELNI